MSMIMWKSLETEFFFLFFKKEKEKVITAICRDKTKIFNVGENKAWIKAKPNFNKDQA